MAGRPSRILAHQHEVARVGYQHQAVAVPVAAHLIALRREPRIVNNRLHLDHTALRNLSLARLAFLHLLGRVEAEVGMARALIGKFAHTEHLGLERCADGVQQIGKRSVARTFPGRATRRAHPPEVGEVAFNRCREFRVHSCHTCLCSLIY